MGTRGYVLSPCTVVEEWSWNGERSILCTVVRGMKWRHPHPASKERGVYGWDIRVFEYELHVFSSSWGLLMLLILPHTHTTHCSISPHLKTKNRPNLFYFYLSNPLYNLLSLWTWTPGGCLSNQKNRKKKILFWKLKLWALGYVRI